MADEKSFIEIDPLALDEEWQDQPRRYLKYARRLADARLEADRAKNALEVCRADCELDIRNDPAKFEIQKATEATIAAATACHDDVKAAQEELLQRRHDVQILEAAVEALQHRKRALENLVQLHMSSYYAAPRARGEGGEAMDAADKRLTRARHFRQRDEDSE